jgi:hypothetical protein
MKKTVILEQSDIDHLHDVVKEALDIPGEIPNDVIIGVWYMLPEHLQEEATHWGLSDSVVRDNIYEWLENNKYIFNTQKNGK